MGSKKEEQRGERYEEIRSAIDEARSSWKPHERNRTIAQLVKEVLEREGQFNFG